jgi:hypothetical protein
MVSAAHLRRLFVAGDNLRQSLSSTTFGVAILQWCLD